MSAPDSLPAAPFAGSGPGTGLGTGQPPQLPHGMRGLIEAPLWGMSIFQLIVAALLLIAIGVCGLFFYRWLRRRRQLNVQVAPDPWSVLIARLRAIKIAPDFSQQAQGDFFFELSWLLREAIEQRLAIPATDMTLRELRDPLQLKLPLRDGSKEGLWRFLERADLVKFAEAPATRAEALAALAQVEEWVRELIPPVGENAAAKGSVAQGFKFGSTDIGPTISKSSLAMPADRALAKNKKPPAARGVMQR